jgi:hypothetical protein
VSLDQAEVVDLITKSPSGEIVLIMSDTGTWDGSPERVLQLQDKLNTYYEFVRSGQLYELHRTRRDGRFGSSSTRSSHSTRPTQGLADQAGCSLADEGIRFVVEQYEPELVERVTAELAKKRRRWRLGRSR